MNDKEIAALLSQKIYKTLTPGEQFGPDNRYKVETVTRENLTSGYYGAVILDTTNQTAYLVNRGTQLESLSDLWADANIVQGDIPEGQIQDANALLIDYARENHDNPNFRPVTVTTGHSLGGYLAQILGVIHDIDVVSFGSPGAQSALNNLKDKGLKNEVLRYDYAEKMTNIVAKNDPIGAFGTHVEEAPLEIIQNSETPSNPIRVLTHFTEATNTLWDIARKKTQSLKCDIYQTVGATSCSVNLENKSEYTLYGAPYNQALNAFSSATLLPTLSTLETISDLSDISACHDVENYVNHTTTGQTL